MNYSHEVHLTLLTCITSAIANCLLRCWAMENLSVPTFGVKILKSSVFVCHFNIDANDKLLRIMYNDLTSMRFKFTFIANYFNHIEKKDNKYCNNLNDYHYDLWNISILLCFKLYLFIGIKVWGVIKALSCFIPVPSLPVVNIILKLVSAWTNIRTFFFITYIYVY